MPASPRPDVGVLIAAAGKGERVGRGEPKQFRPIAGVPMLLRAIRPFAQLPSVRQIVVALPAAFVRRPPRWLDEVAGGVLRLIPGGADRSESVRAALVALDPGCALVLVHDAARPFVAVDTVDAVIRAVAQGRGAVPAVPVTDTLKRSERDTGRVIETVDRMGLWHARTPQGFPREVLEEGYRRAAARGDSVYTDEAALVEAAGFPVQLVPDSATNIKITTAEDFSLAEALASR